MAIDEEFGALPVGYSAALSMAERMMPEKQPIDWPLLSLLYFSQMGAEASKPGATVLGSMASAASAPAAYLMQQRKSQRERELKIPELALDIWKSTKDTPKTVSETKPYIFLTGYNHLLPGAETKVAILPGTRRRLTKEAVADIQAKGGKLRAAEEKLFPLKDQLAHAVQTINDGSKFNPEQFNILAQWLGRERVDKIVPNPDGTSYVVVSHNKGQSYPLGSSAIASRDPLRNLVEFYSGQNEKYKSDPTKAPAYIQFFKALNDNPQSRPEQVILSDDHKTLIEQVKKDRSISINQRNALIDMLQSGQQLPTGMVQFLADRKKLISIVPKQLEQTRKKLTIHNQGDSIAADLSAAANLHAGVRTNPDRDEFLQGTRRFAWDVTLTQRLPIEKPGDKLSDEGFKVLNIGRGENPLNQQIAIQLASSKLGMQSVADAFKILFPEDKKTGKRKFNGFIVARQLKLPIFGRGLMEGEWWGRPLDTLTAGFGKILGYDDGWADEIGDKARRSFYHASRAIELVLRARSGAAVPFHEVKNYLDWYMPSPKDSDIGAREKLAGLMNHFRFVHRLLAYGRKLPAEHWENLPIELDIMRAGVDGVGKKMRYAPYMQWSGNSNVGLLSASLPGKPMYSKEGAQIVRDHSQKVSNSFIELGKRIAKGEAKDINEWNEAELIAYAQSLPTI